MIVDKCAFSVYVSFLGHIIWLGSVQTDQEKFRAVEEWPIPTNARTDATGP